MHRIPFSDVCNSNKRHSQTIKFRTRSEWKFITDNLHFSCLFHNLMCQKNKWRCLVLAFVNFSWFDFKSEKFSFTKRGDDTWHNETDVITYAIDAVIFCSFEKNVPLWFRFAQHQKALLLLYNWFIHYFWLVLFVIAVILTSVDRIFTCINFIEYFN